MGTPVSIYTNIIKEGISQLQKSNYYPYRHSAVVFKSSRIYSSGCNAIRSHSIHKRYCDYEHSLHAEQAALSGLDWKKLKGSSILILRSNVNNLTQFHMARPCPMCLQLIKHIGFSWCYYSNPEGLIVRERVKEMTEDYYKELYMSECEKLKKNTD